MFVPVCAHLEELGVLSAARIPCLAQPTGHNAEQSVRRGELCRSSLCANLSPPSVCLGRITTWMRGRAVMIIHAQKVTKHYRNVTAVQSVSLSAQPGPILALDAPNGAGPACLIRILKIA